MPAPAMRQGQVAAISAFSALTSAGKAKISVFNIVVFFSNNATTNKNEKR